MSDEGDYSIPTWETCSLTVFTTINDVSSSVCLESELANRCRLSNESLFVVGSFKWINRVTKWFAINSESFEQLQDTSLIRSHKIFVSIRPIQWLTKHHSSFTDALISFWKQTLQPCRLSGTKTCLISSTPARATGKGISHLNNIKTLNNSLHVKTDKKMKTNKNVALPCCCDVSCQFHDTNSNYLKYINITIPVVMYHGTSTVCYFYEL